MTTDNNQTPYLMSIPKAAKHFGIGEKKLRALAKELGSRIVVKNGTHSLIRVEALEEYIRTTDHL